MHISEQQQQQEQTAATNGGGGEVVKAADKKQEAHAPAEAEGVNGKSNGSSSAAPEVTESTGSALKPEAEVPTVDNLIQMEEEEEEEEDGQTTPVKASEPPSAAAVAAATAAAAAATAATAAAASESSVVVVTPTSPRSITTASMSASGESTAKPIMSNIVLMGDFFPIFLAGSGSDSQPQEGDERLKVS